VIAEGSRFTSVDEAFAYIEGFTNLERKTVPREYRLDRMRFLLAEFDHPETGIQYIHVAGSKGKGSTATFIAAILQAAGHSTGLYRSPHVTGYRERITRASVEFPDSLYVALIERIRGRIDGIRRRFGDPEKEPTTFELLTLLAFLAFRQSGCTWAVIETGIGGRLDATNVITPAASVLTPVELEHTDILGSTLRAIASEKAGIIKAGVPVFTSAQRPEVLEVFRDRASLLGSAVFSAPDEVEVLESRPSMAGTQIVIRFRDSTRISTTLRLIGAIQAENAALAALVVRALFPTTPASEIEQALSEAFLPGRMELISVSPPILIDGAHTPASIEKVAATFGRLVPADSRGILLFAAADGKRQEEMADILAPLFPDIVVTTPGFFKPSIPEQTHRIFSLRNPAARFVPNPAKALEEVLELSRKDDSERPILVTGSFYLVSEIRRKLIGPLRRKSDHEIPS